MPNLRRRPAFILLLAFLAAAAGCGKQHGAEEAELVPGGTDQAITVDAHDQAFRPQTITVEPHGELVVTVNNRGRQRHTFTAADIPGIDVVLEPGDTKTVRLPTAGQVSFFCRFHEASGMRGVVCPRDGECVSPR